MKNKDKIGKITCKYCGEVWAYNESNDTYVTSDGFIKEQTWLGSHPVWACECGVCLAYINTGGEHTVC